MQLKLATTRNFNGNELACYVEDKPANDFDFWATREQIGRFLGYTNPRKAIGNIHERNKERLDKFSSALNLRTEAGMRTTTVYSFKGLLEVCRFSNQPVANQVIDILWDIADEIMHKGYYMSPKAAVCLANAIQEREALRAQNQALKKYIQDNSSFTLLGQAISPVKGTLSFGETAKIFSQNGLKIGQNRLFKRAREVKVLAKRKGRQYNQPTQWAIENGLCVMVINVGSKGTPYLTMKGAQFFADDLAKEQLPLLSLISGCDALHE